MGCCGAGAFGAVWAHRIPGMTKQNRKHTAACIQRIHLDETGHALNIADSYVDLSPPKVVDGPSARSSALESNPLRAAGRAFHPDKKCRGTTPAVSSIHKDAPMNPRAGKSASFLQQSPS